jgi:hypothetical protein
MSHLLFGFRDLVNSNPNNSVFDLSSFFFDDSYLKSLSPKRYNFYVKFVSGLSNPSVLEKFFYKTKESRDYKDELNTKASNLANLINRLNTNFDKNERNKIVDDIMNTIKNKYKMNDDNLNKLDELLKKGGVPIEEKDIYKYELNKGNEPMKKFLTKINTIAPEIGSKPPLNDISELLIDPSTSKEVSTSKNPIQRQEMIKKVKNIYNNYKDTLSPDSLKITMIDRIIFITTTFILRFIALMLIDWGLNTNLINSFHRAFYIYCIIYIVFFIFIAMIVNVIVYYPIMELFSNSGITQVPNMFYYFYVYTNGSARLLLHLFIIILLLFIPYVIDIDKIQLSKIDENTKNISYDYEKKTKIYDAISLFSLIVWILTSVIAIKF